MNYDPIEVVIGKTVSTFRLKEWQYDIEEFAEEIAEALKFIGAAKIYEDKVARLKVNNYVAKLPKDCQHIKGLIPSHIPYKESGNFLEISKPNGTEVTLSYQAMPTDVRGYPLVPDAVEVREALMWYLVKIKCLQREITHIAFDYAEREWQWRCGSARAVLNVWSVQQAQAAYQNFTRLNPLKDQHYKDYKGLDMPNTLNREKNRDSYE